MLYKISKIDVENFTTVDAMPSGSKFPTPSWAWNWHWGCYKNSQKISKALYVEQNPEIHVKSFQTQDAMAQDSIFQQPCEPEGVGKGMFG